eukprot:Nk52_evm38s2449 gene=Nk52_evmTU38s2449
MDKLLYSYYETVQLEGREITNTLLLQNAETLLVEFVISILLTGAFLFAYLHFVSSDYDVDEIYRRRMEEFKARREAALERSAQAGQDEQQAKEEEEGEDEESEETAIRQRKVTELKKKANSKKSSNGKENEKDSERNAEIKAAMLKSEFLEKDLEMLNRHNAKPEEIDVKVRLSFSDSSNVMADAVKSVKVMSNATLETLKSAILADCFPRNSSDDYVWTPMKQEYTPEMRDKVMLKLFKGTLGGFDFGNSMIDEAPLHELEVHNDTMLYLVAYGKEN